LLKVKWGYAEAGLSWGKEYGGMDTEQRRRLKELEVDLSLKKNNVGGSGKGKLLNPARRRECV